MLSKYRILDLTDEKGLVCGRILGDLGAEVIKVEKPGGDAARNIGPFYGDESHPEKSLFWFAYNCNKKSITLNLETPDGREIFKRLASVSHVIIESYHPAYLEGLGIGYPQLTGIKPRLIMTSITPFGQKGPYAQYKGSNITSIASSGYMYLTGDADRPPLGMGFPFSYVQAGAHAALGTMIALSAVHSIGRGQHVNVSMQESMVPQLINAIPYWTLHHSILKRAGQLRVGVGAGVMPRQTWRCKDGYVHFTLRGGLNHVKTNSSLFKWMESAGYADSFLRSIDWATLDMVKIDQNFVEKTEKPIAAFFASQTKDDLYLGGLNHHIDIYPVCTPKDLAVNEQLLSRNFWIDVQHTKPDVKLKYPASFVQSSEGDVRIRRPSPNIGEHNQEVYGELLGISAEELSMLKGTGAI